jgi:hypothetical protein
VYIGAALGGEGGEGFVGDVEAVAYVDRLSAFSDEGTYYFGQDSIRYLSIVYREIEYLADLGRHGEKFGPVKRY